MNKSKIGFKYNKRDLKDYYKKKGYLAKYLNKDDFAEGIKWVNNMLNSDENFFINSRKEVEIKLNNNKILQDHINLYEEIQKKN